MPEPVPHDDAVAGDGPSPAALAAKAIIMDVLVACRKADNNAYHALLKGLYDEHNWQGLILTAHGMSEAICIWNGLTDLRDKVRGNPGSFVGMAVLNSDGSHLTTPPEDAEDVRLIAAGQFINAHLNADSDQAYALFRAKPMSIMFGLAQIIYDYYQGNIQRASL